MVAEKKAEVGVKCLVACSKLIQEIKQSGRIAIDDKWLILKEYKENLLHSEKVGLGGIFLK